MEAKGVRVEGRIVPWPSSISEQARAFLTSIVSPDGTPLWQQDEIAPDDFAGWRKSQARLAIRLADLTHRRPAPQASSETVTLAGVKAYVATPPGLKPDDLRTILDIHGGSFVYGDGEFCRRGGQAMADLHGARCVSVDYRVPPQAAFPLPLDDCVAVYRHLVGERGAKNVIVIGGSAGGNLAAALVLRARDEGLPLPAAVVLKTPELDLTESGDSFQVNRYVDVTLVGSLANSIAAYAQGHDLTDPYLSPLFGDFDKGFAPTYLDAGTRDMFLSNAARMHRRLIQAKVPAELHIHEGSPHGGFGGAPEDIEASEAVKDFVARHWPAPV